MGSYRRIGSRQQNHVGNVGHLLTLKPGRLAVFISPTLRRIKTRRLFVVSPLIKIAKTADVARSVPHSFGPRPLAPAPNVAVVKGVTAVGRRIPTRHRLAAAHHNLSPRRLHRRFPSTRFLLRLPHLARLGGANLFGAVVGISQSIASGRHRLGLQRLQGPTFRHLVNPQ